MLLVFLLLLRVRSVFSFKEGVSISKLEPQLVLGLLSVYSIFEEHGYDAVVTSVSDGIHRSGSFHYVGCAADLRIRHLGKSDVVTLVKSIRAALGSNFDVVLEVDHIHIEYDPK